MMRRADIKRFKPFKSFNPFSPATTFVAGPGEQR